MKYIAFMLLCLPLTAQSQLERDAAGCFDSSKLPKMESCRIDNCDKKESDHREVPVREDEHGEAVISPLDGESRSIMYECREGTLPADVVQRAAASLRVAGYEVPYQFADKEATLTAHKGDSWILLDAASHYYTLVELTAVNELESASDAVSMAEAIERYGHVPAYGITFLPGRADISPESVLALREVAAMMEDHPDWRIRIEGHTDNLGTKAGNLLLSQKRALAVSAWLVNRGVKRIRIETAGLADEHPVASNNTEADRARNRRIELVRITGQ
jgi:outer membrane protein OmpA-like peptidoglycan-associated protein